MTEVEMKTDSVFYLALKWRWHLITVALIALVSSALFSSSYFIKPKYKSSAVVYPVNLVPYSNESATEQLLQLLQSGDVRQAVIKKFNLSDHYSIGNSSDNPNAKLIREYNDNVNIAKTEFESVNIDVLDTDPQLACDMVNEIVGQTNLKARQLQREKSKEIHKMVLEQITEKKAEIDSLQSQIKYIRTTYNFIDIGAQGREVTRGIIGSVKSSEAREMSEGMKQRGAELATLTKKLDDALGYYARVKNSYDDVTADLNKELTYTNIVNKPFPADTKSYPVRWLIVSLSTVLSLLLAVIIISIAESKKKSPNQSL